MIIFGKWLSIIFLLLVPRNDDVTRGKVWISKIILSVGKSYNNHKTFYKTLDRCHSVWLQSIRLPCRDVFSTNYEWLIMLLCLWWNTPLQWHPGRQGTFLPWRPDVLRRETALLMVRCHLLWSFRATTSIFTFLEERVMESFAFCLEGINSCGLTLVQMF